MFDGKFQDAKAEHGARPPRPQAREKYRSWKAFDLETSWAPKWKTSARETFVTPGPASAPGSGGSPRMLSSSRYLSQLTA